MQGQELGSEGIPAAIPPPTLGASFHHATTQQQVPSSAPRLEGVLDTRPQPSQSAGQKYTDQHPAPADPRGDPCVFVASGQRSAGVVTAAAASAAAANAALVPLSQPGPHASDWSNGELLRWNNVDKFRDAGVRLLSAHI